jgi:hypothetical protein
MKAALAIINSLQKAFRTEAAKSLLRPDWHKENINSNIPSTGFCYIATEALFYLIGGVKSGYKPMCASYSEGTHWWLQKGNKRLDPTADQYGDEEPPYHLGKGCGFQNGYKQPSKRAKKLIEIVCNLHF